jgi:hypothetical protein
LKTGWSAGARSARDVAPSVPYRRPAPGPHRPPSVRRHGVDHASVNVAGATDSRSHARAAVDRVASCACRRSGHTPCPTRRGPADRATWRACAPLDLPDAPCSPPASHLLGRSSEPPLRVRRRRRSDSPVRPTVHRPCSSSSVAVASNRTPCTLPCTCIGRPTRRLDGIAAAAADRRLPRRRPLPQPLPAEPTPPSDRG